MDCPTCRIPMSQRRYEGPIRLARPGSLTPGAHAVEGCARCGIAGLDLAPLDYTQDEYRRAVDGEAGVESFAQIHDWEQA